MPGSNDGGRRPLSDRRSRFKSRNETVRRHGLGANVVKIDTAENELIDKLKTLGDDILKEPLPERLLDALRKTKR